MIKSALYSEICTAHKKKKKKKSIDRCVDTSWCLLLSFLVGLVIYGVQNRATNSAATTIVVGARRTAPSQHVGYEDCVQKSRGSCSGEVRLVCKLRMKLRDRDARERRRLHRRRICEGGERLHKQVDERDGLVHGGSVECAQLRYLRIGVGRSRGELTAV